MSIAADDRGLTLADGLFETILCVEGRLILWDAHIARLRRSCETLGLPAPNERDLAAAVAAALQDASLGPGRAALRLTWTAGSGGRGLDRPAVLEPRLIVSAAPAPSPTGPARLAVSDIRRNEGSPASRLKTLGYLDNVLAREQARRRGAHEALMLNNRGEVACAAAANLFWVRGEALHTPALECGVLDGVMRAQVLAEARRLGLACSEEQRGLEDLLAADAVFLTNSLIGVRAVEAVDEKRYSRSEVVERLIDAIS